MKIKSFLITAVLVTVILCVGGAVKAQSVDNSALIAQIQAQIQALTLQIQQMLAAQSGASATPATSTTAVTPSAQTTSAASWCYTFSTYLTTGSTDTTTSGAVKQLQTALTKSGFNISADAAGTFGNATQAAVIAFQAKYGITQTGSVGPITRAQLNFLYGCTTSPINAATVKPQFAPPPTSAVIESVSPIPPAGMLTCADEVYTAEINTDLLIGNDYTVVWSGDCTKTEQVTGTPTNKYVYSYCSINTKKNSVMDVTVKVTNKNGDTVTQELKSKITPLSNVRYSISPEQLMGTLIVIGLGCGQ